MQKIHYISDLHFGHYNIIRFDGRPFWTVNEMDSKLIENWNSAVGSQDTVYILGDFSWHNARNTEAIIKQLNGNKVLVRGNHDKWSKDNGCKKLFQEICDYKIINDSNKTVVMSHYPIMFYQSQHRGAIHLYGHVHNTIEQDLFQQVCENLKRQTDIPMNCYNVGCMMPYMGFTPRTLLQILKNN